MSDDKVGYGKPPKHTQFGQPNGNPMGETSEQRKRSMASAAKAGVIRDKILDGVLKEIDGGKDVMELIEAATLKMLVDAENRGWGAPKVTIEADVSTAPKGLDTFYGDGCNDE